jgi:prophage regulatory protein
MVNAEYLAQKLVAFSENVRSFQDVHFATRGVTMQPNRFLSSKAVENLTSFSRSTLDRKVAAGEFPASVKISERRKAYPEAAVHRWMSEKLQFPWPAT